MSYTSPLLLCAPVLPLLKKLAVGAAELLGLLEKLVLSEAEAAVAVGSGCSSNAHALNASRRQ
jgi:hypothetical protein